MEDGKDNKAGLSINDLIEDMFTTPGERVTPGRRRHIESQKLFVEEVLDKALHAVKSGKRVRATNFGTFFQRIARETVFNPGANEDRPVKNRIRLGFTPASKTVDELNK